MNLLFLITFLITNKPQIEIHAVPHTELDLTSMAVASMPGPVQTFHYPVPLASTSPPLWDVVLAGPYLFASFPERHLVIRFSLKNQKTLIFGPQDSGGNGVPFKKPGHLFSCGNFIQVYDLASGDIFLLDYQGTIKNFDQPKSQEFLFPGPRSVVNDPTSHGRYLQVTPHSGNLLSRLDQRGRILLRYGLGPDERSRKEDPLDWTFRGRVWIQRDWSLVYTQFATGQIYSIDPNGLVINRIHLYPNLNSSSAPFPVRYLWQTLPLPSDHLKAACLCKEDLYALILWQSIDYLLKVHNGKGTLFPLETSFDGMDVQNDHLVLFDRSKARIQVFNRP